MKATRWLHRLVVLTLLLATALRFMALDAQSFWNDEGNTARLVERPVPLIIEGVAADIHPPGYYLLLHVWRAAAGESEFALRGFSVFCGILTVAVAAAVARRIGGWGTALGATLLAAVHPLAVYYSQEARMYALLGLASALTYLAAVELVLWLEAFTPLSPPHLDGKPPLNSYRREGSTILPPMEGARGRKLIMHTLLLACCIALGLYTQYAYVFALAGLNLAFGLWWLSHRPWQWRAIVPWISAHILGGLAFAPWAPIAMGASDWRPPDLVTEQALQHMTRAMLTGITLPADKGQYVLFLGGALALLGLLRLRRARFAGWAAVGMATLPPLVVAAMGVYRPAYIKLLMSTVVPVTVWLTLPLGYFYPPQSLQTRGKADFSPHRRNVPSRQKPRRSRAGELEGGKWLSFLLRAIAVLLLIGLFVVQVTSLRHLYTDPAYARDDYRGIAACIRAEGRPGDGILLSAPNQWEVFTYYYKGPQPVYPAPYHPTPEEAATWVEEITRKHPRLFVLYWGDAESDPQHLVETALAREAYKADDTWVGTVRWARYGSTPAPPISTAEVSATLGQRIMLESYALPSLTYAPGDVIPLALSWRAKEAPGEPLKVFVHMLNAGQLVAQNDGEPLDGLYPTYQWEAGTQLVDRYGLWLPADIPPGNYSLTVGMYRYSGERLPISQDGEPVGDALHLATVQVR